LSNQLEYWVWHQR